VPFHRYLRPDIRYSGGELEDPGGERFHEDSSSNVTPVSEEDLKRYAEAAMQADAAARHEDEAALQSDAVLQFDVGLRTEAAASGVGDGGRSLAPPDAELLRSVMGQLCRGVGALHEADCVHRDLKPSNVLVTDEGRVVILDFGLAKQTTGEEVTGGGIAGTPIYMAPEQVRDRHPAPALDWYAVGTMLYQILVGRTPFRGNMFDVLVRKQWDTPPSPREVNPRVDGELDALCMALLAKEPAERPQVREILQRLGIDPDDGVDQEAHGGGLPSGAVSGAVGVVGSGPGPRARVAQTFVGRDAEMGALWLCYDRMRSGSLQLVLVQGTSGIGKTCLVERFLDDQLGEVPDPLCPLVLRGRCHERETVPFKAFDAIVDGLSNTLARMEDAELEALLPRDISFLADIFPVLRRIELIEASRFRRSEVGDQSSERSLAFAALRGLLVNLAARRPLVAFIDDLQWADSDSVALLHALLEEPGAPALLLIATCRPLVADAGSVACAISALDSLECGTTLDVGPLPEESTAELVRQLLGAEDEPAHQSAGEALVHIGDAIAREAGGNPFFVDELVRYLRGLEGEPGVSHTSASVDDVRLDRLVLRRLGALSETCQRLMELVAVAGDPLPQSVVADALASHLNVEQWSKGLELLEDERLIRRHGLRTQDRVEPYHDRIRQAVVAGLGSGQRAGLHRQLAEAMESWDDAGPHRLARHWLAAEAPDHARRYVRRAAVEAREKLAFARAARLYETALELESEDGARTELHNAMGDCLALSGMSARAAEAYLAGVRSATGDRAEALRQMAAEQLLRAGEIARGLDVLGEVLAAQGLRLVPTARGAQLSVARRLIALRLRGTKFQHRPAETVSHRDARRLDLLWAANIGLSMVDAVRADDFLLRFLRLALKVGDVRRVALGKAMLAAQLGALAGPFFGWARELSEEAIVLAESVDDPKVVGMARMCAEVVRYFSGDFSGAADGLMEVERHFLEACHGVSWEIATARSFMCWAFRMSGRLKELGERMDRYVADAELRGDVLTATNLRTYQSIIWLVRDDPDRAEHEIAGALDTWPKDVYQIQHLFHLYARCEIALYRDRPTQAWEFLELEDRRVRRSGLLRVSGLRLEYARIRGRAVLALAATKPEGERRALLKVAARSARTLAKAEHRTAVGMGALLEAGRVNLAPGRREEEVRAALERAVAVADDAHSPLLAATGRRRQGELMGGDWGSEVVRRADDWMVRQGVRSPHRLTQLLVPGFVV